MSGSDGNGEMGQWNSGTGEGGGNGEVGGIKTTRGLETVKRLGGSGVGRNGGVERWKRRGIGLVGVTFKVN